MTEHLGKKKKALKRAREHAARAYRAGRGATEIPPPADVRAEPVVDRLLQAYGELTDATVELYRQLDRDDPRRQQLRDALAHAGEVAGAILAESGTAAGADGSITAPVYSVDDYSTAGSSLELVRIAPDPPRAPDPPPAPDLPAVVRRVRPRRLPDEAWIVRYARVRRATHRWPDESWLSRYLRDRALPDETGLTRAVRRRRALYDRYA